MNQQPAENLFRACRVLFGSNISINPEFLHYLQLSGVKSAFRKRALATHPDMLQSSENRFFIEIKRAYDVLSSFVTKRDYGNSHSAERVRAATTYHYKNHRSTGTESATGKYQRNSNPRSFYFHGSLPRGRLRFAEYVYYSGIVSWKTLIESIVWQRKQRPSFGEIAQEWAWLPLVGAGDLLFQRIPGERIGETAVRLQHLNQK